MWMQGVILCGRHGARLGTYQQSIYNSLNPSILSDVASFGHALRFQSCKRTSKRLALAYDRPRITRGVGKELDQNAPQGVFC